MFTANLAVQKNYQKELQRQAEYYRLVRSVERPYKIFSRLANILGNLMVFSGRRLVTLAEAVR